MSATVEHIAPANSASTAPARKPQYRGLMRAAKLDWEQVRDIRTSWANGEPLASITARYPVSKNGIYQVLINRNWHDPSYIPGIRRLCLCGGCSTRFRTTNEGKLFCSTRCQNVHRKRERAGYYERHPEELRDPAACLIK